MITSKYSQLDTPALIIDYDIVKRNIYAMQEKADKFGVKLRPHTKTHKMPDLARLQVESGAAGITVAKVGEAEVMAAHGLQDIFIANEIVGISKLERIRELSRNIRVRLGVDNAFQVFNADRQAKTQQITLCFNNAMIMFECQHGVEAQPEIAFKQS